MSLFNAYTLQIGLKSQCTHLNKQREKRQYVRVLIFIAASRLLTNDFSFRIVK